jgi:hypothetical protein
MWCDCCFDQALEMYGQQVAAGIMQHNRAKDRCHCCRALQPLDRPAAVAHTLRQPGTELATATLHAVLIIILHAAQRAILFF